VIERGAVESFATAVKDDHPAYHSAAAAADAGFAGIPLPPTFLFVTAQRGAFSDLQPEAPAGSADLGELIGALRDGREGLILHGGQQFNYLGQICAGDVLTLDGVVESAETKPGSESKPGMSVLVVRTDYRRDGSDEVLATTRSTFLFRPRTN
jgi:hypothetical protein